MTPKPRERTRLLGVLTALTLLATSGLLIWRTELIAPVWAIAAVAAPWVALSIFLRIKKRSYGREGRVVDLWSIPHFIGGSLLGLFGIGIVTILVVTIWWEIVETISHVHECRANRVMDVLLAASGWILANLVFAGPFTLW